MKRNKPQRVKMYPVRQVAALVFAVPFTLVGLLLCTTIIGIPVGILVIVLGAWPFIRVHQRIIKDKVAREVDDSRRIRDDEEAYQDFVRNKEVPWQL